MFGFFTMPNFFAFGYFRVRPQGSQFGPSISRESTNPQLQHPLVPPRPPAGPRHEVTPKGQLSLQTKQDHRRQCRRSSNGDPSESLGLHSKPQGLSGCP